MADRATIPGEIEITPEMIAAGANALWHAQMDYPTDESVREVASRIFYAMAVARQESHS
jgi:hypothetical protein